MMFEVLVTSLLAALLSMAIMTLSADTQRLNELGRQLVLAESQLIDLEGRHRLAVKQGLDAGLPHGKLCNTTHQEWLMQWCATNQAVAPAGAPSSVCVSQNGAGYEAAWLASSRCHEAGALRATRRWVVQPISHALEATL